MGHVTVQNDDGSVTTYFGEEDMPKKSSREAKVVASPADKPAAKTRARAESK